MSEDTKATIAAVFWLVCTIIGIVTMCAIGLEFQRQCFMGVFNQ